MSEEKELLKKLRSDFFDIFSKKIREYGFIRATRGGDFYTSTSYGSKGITLFLGNRWGAFRVQPNMFIRVDEIERLLFEFRTTVRGDTDLKKPNRVTICKNLGNIKSGFYRSWNNYSEADVVESAEEIDSMVKIYGIPFIENIDGFKLLLDDMLRSTDRIIADFLAYERENKETCAGDDAVEINLRQPKIVDIDGFREVLSQIVESAKGKPRLLDLDDSQKLLILSLILNRKDLLEKYLPYFELMVRNRGKLQYDEFLLFRLWIIEKFDASDGRSRY